MHKRYFVFSLILGLLLMLSGCRFFSTDPPDEPIDSPYALPPDLPGDLISLSFSESHSYRARVQGYDFRIEDGKCTAYFRLADEDEPCPVPVDEVWVDKLTDIVRVHNMHLWDGFSESDAMLLDGTSFSISLTFSDGTTVSARGYGRFPEGYGSASAEIGAHFLQLLPEEMRGW